MSLSLTRHLGQSLTIGDDIRVRVVEIDAARRCVKLAIDAPLDVEIVRSELLYRTGGRRCP